MYKFCVRDRQYSDFSYMDVSSHKIIYLDINPAENKLFNLDVFDMDDSKNITISQSSVRSSQSIPAVLVLEGNKMYGKHKGKFLYRCLPNDRKMPTFLIPYKNKLSFSKKFINKYVTIRYRHWEGKHPAGVLLQNLGDVSLLTSFNEYQLHCKDLHSSIKGFTKKTMSKLKDRTEDEWIKQILSKHSVSDRRKSDIITIDPAGSKDFDDAFGLINGEDNAVQLSVYIANVPLWLDIMELWGSFSSRISTIYLPDRNLPMLPRILSDKLCSLQARKNRFAFTADILINTKTYSIQNVRILNTIINVRENFVYGTKRQKEYPLFSKVFDIVVGLNTVHKYLDDIQSSHDVIAYLMIMMNHLCAKKMYEKKIGIYRSVTCRSDTPLPDKISPSMIRFVRAWNSSGGTYTKFKSVTSHDALGLDLYTHITSPIRRLVDILNIIQLQRSLKTVEPSIESLIFYNNWINDLSLAHINNAMKSIRKVQNDCALLKLCMEDSTVLGSKYEGFVLDIRSYYKDKFQYTVYIPKIKMVNKLISKESIDKYRNYTFRLYLFVDETQLRQKIRLSLCTY